MTGALVVHDAMFLQVGRRRYAVASFEQASAMFCVARDRHGAGAGRTPSPLLVDGDGTLIGYVSYNGRVWAGHPLAWSSDTRLLHDNRRA